MSQKHALGSDPFAWIQAETDAHRAAHGCWAYSFQDGPALGVLSGATQAKRVLELGTALGYTACWLAHGSPQAHVDTIEQDPVHLDLAQHNVHKAGFASRVSIHQGSFQAVLPGLTEPYDLIFFDGYDPDLELLKTLDDMLRPGGVLICSNLQLNAKQTEPCLEMLFNSPRWQSAMLAEGGKTAVSVKIMTNDK